MNKFTKEWIEKAEGDYLIISKLKPELEPVWGVCFHAQQCVEKYLKAILQENNREFKRVHDLKPLLEDCTGFIPELQNHEEKIRDLSNYAVEERYPGSGASKKEAQEAILATEEIRKVIRKYFGLSIKQQAEQKIEQQKANTQELKQDRGQNIKETQDVHHDRGRHR